LDLFARLYRDARPTKHKIHYTVFMAREKSRMVADGNDFLTEQDTELRIAARVRFSWFRN